MPYSMASQGITVLPQTRRMPTLYDAIDTLKSALTDQQNQQDERSRQGRLAAALYVQQVQKLPPDQQQYALANAPDDVKQYLIDPSKLPAHQPTADEKAQNNYNNFLLDASGDFKSPLNADPSKVALFNDKAAGSKPFFDYQGQRFNYQNGAALPPQVGEARQVADKLKMDARDTALVPSEVAKNTATAGNQNAEAAYTSGPRTATERNLGTKYNAETAKVNAQTGQINSLVGNGDGGPNEVVQNWVNAVKGAAAQGLDPGVVLKRIKDKNVAAAVGNELAKPENAKILAQSPLAQKQRDTLAEIDPLIQQTQAVMSALEPYKTKNGLTDRMSVDYLKYKAGVMPDETSPAAQIANLQMLGVQAGARLLKGGSRAYPALQMAMQHAPNAMKDTYANAYDKANKLLQQLQNVRDANARFGQPLTEGGVAGTSAAQPSQQPASSKPNSVSMTQLKQLAEHEGKPLGQVLQEAKGEGLTVTDN